jgi:hypothetical protein
VTVVVVVRYEYKVDPAVKVTVVAVLAKLAVTVNTLVAELLGSPFV